jgi:hypothetical protein
MREKKHIGTRGWALRCQSEGDGAWGRERRDGFFRKSDAPIKKRIQEDLWEKAKAGAAVAEGQKGIRWCACVGGMCLCGVVVAERSTRKGGKGVRSALHGGESDKRAPGASAERFCA